MSGGREWQGFKVKKPDERDIIRLNLNLRTENFRYSVCKLATDHAGYLALFDFCRYKATKAIYSAVTLLNLSFFVYLRLPQSILIMTDRTEQNAEALFVAARKGDKYAFFKLIPGFYREIYSLVFRVIPDRERAEEVLTEIFVLAADNIAHVKEDRDVFEWLRKLSIIVALYNLRGHPLYNGGRDEIPPFQESFSEVEKVYASLTDIERVVLALYLQFDYSPANIAGFVTGETEEGITALLLTKLERLAFFSGFKELVTIHKDDFHKLVVLHGAGSGDVPADTSDSYIKFIDLCCNLFSDIAVRDALLEIIRDELINEDKIKARHSRKKEERSIELNRLAESTARQAASPLTMKADVLMKKMVMRSGLIDRRNLVLTLMAIAIVAAGVWGYIYYSKFNLPWNLSRVDGSVSVNGTVVLEAAEGDSVTTGPASSVKIEIGKQGTITLFENSKMIPVKGHVEENIFSFSGTGFKLVSRIDTSTFFEYSDIPPFRIKLPAFDILTEIIDMEASPNRVTVHFGWAEVLANGESVFLASDHSVDMSPGLKMHVPVFAGTDSSQKARIEFLNTKGLYGSALTEFIVSAADHDALSLIYLLKKTTKEDRGRIAAKLEEYFPAIDDEVKKGLIEENAETLDYVTGFLKWLLLFR